MKIQNEKELLKLALSAAEENDDPRLFWLLSNLASISSVTFSDEIETACIRKTGETYSIQFNPDFVRKYLSTADDILFVLLHEIFHKIQGDFLRDLKIQNQIDEAVANIVEDIVINARLCRLFFPQAVPLFEKLYSPEIFPEIILIPPNVLDCWRILKENLFYKPCDEFCNYEFERMHDCEFYNRIQPVFNKVKNLPKTSIDLTDNPELQKIERNSWLKGLVLWYWYAWSGLDKITTTDLYDTIRPLFPEAPTVILLGDHKNREGNLPGWEDLFEGHQAGYSEDEKEEQTEILVSYQYVPKMIRLLKKALELDLSNPRQTTRIMPEQSIIPWPGRRENLWLANGLLPVFYKPPVMLKDLEYLRPHLYLDVSASTKEFQPIIYGLIAHCGDIIGQPIYLFSNKVFEISLKDLRQGKIITTGGTDYDCVIEHALKNHFKKIIIVTDGYAELRPENQAKIKQQNLKIYLILTNPSNPIPQCFEDYTNNVFYLNF